MGLPGWVCNPESDVFYTKMMDLRLKLMDFTLKMMTL